MRVEKNVPEIRFEGVSGEWKISQLSELALFNPKEELPVTFKYVDLESVKGTSLLGYREELKESAPSRAQRLAKKGDVFFQTVRPYQKNNYLFNMEEIDFVFSTGYAQLRPYYDGNFLLNLIQRDSFVKDVLDNCTGTSYPAINASILASLEVISPEGKEEQTAIGNTFQKLDNLINQHQQKHEKLSNLKKAMLEKMFPKVGESVPEIRFDGFSGDWGYKSLSKVANNISDGDWIEAEHIFPRGMYRIIQTGNIGVGRFLNNEKHAKYFHQRNFDIINANEIYTGDILISRLAEPAGRATILPDTGFRMVTAVDVTILRPDDSYDSYFLMTYLNTDNCLRRVSEGVAGTSHKRISRVNLVKIDIPLPNIDEQKKIGKHFERLDSLIEQHNQQITKLKNIKQACLDKMFV